ncbi:NlpC/P60 family protein [Paenibacillus antri]|uniref:NlpC/P60 family protein n=1 Tax=Paenibacillus antri TaxID=2582848 RepID=A0A5R9G7D5_9BACL|nr:C40 family peptidase [Paenibacillus antri]TLS50000.1 NlpC/P60 family protein [Paenibacillus antri]
MKKVSLLLSGALLAMAFQANVALADDTKLESAVNEVVGTPYLWGGTTTEGFDCSGFLSYIFKQFSTQLPRTSKLQAEAGDKVAKADLRPGDLVFFNTDGKGISHAGVYIGDGRFAHSSSSYGVRISGLDEEYYKTRYVTARRIVYGQNYLSMEEKLSHESETTVLTESN